MLCHCQIYLCIKIHWQQTRKSCNKPSILWLTSCPFTNFQLMEVSPSRKDRAVVMVTFVNHTSCECLSKRPLHSIIRRAATDHLWVGLRKNFPSAVHASISWQIVCVCVDARRLTSLVPPACYGIQFTVHVSPLKQWTTLTPLVGLGESSNCWLSDATQSATQSLSKQPPGGSCSTTPRVIFMVYWILGNNLLSLSFSSFLRCYYFFAK